MSNTQSMTSSQTTIVATDGDTILLPKISTLSGGFTGKVLLTPECKSSTIKQAAGDTINTSSSVLVVTKPITNTNRVISLSISGSNWVAAVSDEEYSGNVTGSDLPLPAIEGGTGLSGSGTDSSKALMSDGFGGFIMGTPSGGGGLINGTNTVTVSTDVPAIVINADGITSANAIELNDPTSALKFSVDGYGNAVVNNLTVSGDLTVLAGLNAPVAGGAFTSGQSIITDSRIKVDSIVLVQMTTVSANSGVPAVVSYDIPNNQFTVQSSNPNDNNHFIYFIIQTFSLP